MDGNGKFYKHLFQLKWGYGQQPLETLDYIS